MIISNGRRILKSFHQFSVLVRFMSLPQGAETTPGAVSVAKTKVKKDSFLKAAFLGKLEDDFLHFRSRKSSELPDSLRRFIESVESANEESDNYSLQLKKFAENGFFSLNSPGLSGEIVTVGDLLHLYEDLNLNPELSALLDLHSTYIIPTLSNYGSTDLKDSYLEKVLKGDLSGAFAVCEESGSDPTVLKSTAHEKSGEFILHNTEKCWVTNALNADFFILIAKCPAVNLKVPEHGLATDLCAFIVDKNNKIALAKHELLGLNNCGIAKVKFSGVSIPEKNIIGAMSDGYSIVADGLKSPKFITCICILNHLKKFIADTVEHINNRKLFPRDLKDCEIVKSKLSSVVKTAYIYESMLYFTADLMDSYEIDTSLESALLQVYGFEYCMNAISICMELLGSKSYDKKFPFEKLWCDLRGLSLFNPTQFTRIAAALLGLEYAGNYLNDSTKVGRNPLQFPFRALKKMYSVHQILGDKVKPKRELYINLHPSLKEAAEQLDCSLTRFNFAVESLFVRHGAEVVFRQIDLNRLADVALEIFGMTCVLSRASHSYCTGVQHCDQEILMAKSVCFESEERIKKIMESVVTGVSHSFDSASIELAAHIVSKKQYFVAPPFTHNI